jgi:PAS domain S-box-containing protein
MSDRDIDDGARKGGQHPHLDLERFFALSVDLLCVADFEGHLARVNPAFERALGYTKGELVRDPFMSFVHPDDREATAAVYADVMGGGAAVGDFENRYRCADGSYRWLQWSSVTDDDAGLVYAVARDVTEAKESETRLRNLLAEQAALRRVATLVARGGEHAEVVSAVAEEVGKLLSADAAGVVRYEPEGHGTIVGTWSRSGVAPVPVGTSVDLESGTSIGRVYGTGEPGRSTGFEGAAGSLAHRLAELGYRSSLAAPIRLEGRVWGALAVADVREEPLAEGAEQRLVRFGDLVA